MQPLGLDVIVEGKPIALLLCDVALPEAKSDAWAFISSGYSVIMDLSPEPRESAQVIRR